LEETDVVAEAAAGVAEEVEAACVAPLAAVAPAAVDGDAAAVPAVAAEEPPP
jgi:hypothetical protein